jgi:hypothetical protein
VKARRNVQYRDVGMFSLPFSLSLVPSKGVFSSL